ncbi:MAG: FliM/FliN family flagellar motor switch protein [Pseudomonadota bacterium]
MNDKILSDGEMDALMEGMADGSVEVLRGGGRDLTQVRPFEIKPQCYLRFGSYPELARLNEKFAVGLQRYLRQVLNWPASCDLKRQYERNVADLPATFGGLQHVMGYRIAPLDGVACVLPSPAMVAALVEVFFGSTNIPAVDPTLEEYSTGQKRTAQRFADAVMTQLAAAWATLLALSPTFEQSWPAVEQAPLGGPKDAVIVSEFQIVAGDFEADFAIVIGRNSLHRFTDLLDGAERPGNAEQNQRWRRTLEIHAIELPVRLAMINQSAAVSLARLTELSPGDELPIAAPNPIDVACGDVVLYRGQFGVNGKRRVVRIDARAELDSLNGGKHV